MIGVLAPTQQSGKEYATGLGLQPKTYVVIYSTMQARGRYLDGVVCVPGFQPERDVVTALLPCIDWLR